MQDKIEISKSYPPHGSCSEDWVCAGRGQPSWLPLRIPSSPEGGCVPVCCRGKNSRHGELSHLLRVTGCTSRSGWAGKGLLVYRPQSIHEINVMSSVCPTMLQSTESSVRIIKWKGSGAFITDGFQSSRVRTKWRLGEDPISKIYRKKPFSHIVGVGMGGRGQGRCATWLGFGNQGKDMVVISLDQSFIYLCFSFSLLNQTNMH